MNLKLFVVGALLAISLIGPASSASATLSYEHGQPASLSEGQYVNIIVDFGTAFSSVEWLVVDIEFGSDGLDTNEEWYAPKIGGQGNLDSATRINPQLTQIDPFVLSQFLDGHEAIDLYATAGSFDLQSVRFVIGGEVRSHSVPEPGGLTLLTIGIIGMSRQSLRRLSRMREPLRMSACLAGSPEFSALVHC